MSKDWTEVVRINRSVANILLFRIDVLPSSKSIGLGSELTRTEVNDKIKLEQIFGLSCLLPDKNFSSQKIFEIPVICDNINK